MNKGKLIFNTNPVKSLLLNLALRVRNVSSKISVVPNKQATMFHVGFSRSCLYRTRLHLSTLLNIILFAFVFFGKVDGMKKLYVENESKKGMCNNFYSF